MIVLEWLRAVDNIDAVHSAEVFLGSAFVNVLESAPAADVVDQHLAEIWPSADRSDEAL